MNTNDLNYVQNHIDYRFKNLDLLQQAFIRRSYSEEHGGGDNEVLEFIGDKALDLMVVKFLSDKYGYFDHEDEEDNSRRSKSFRPKENKPSVSIPDKNKVHIRHAYMDSAYPN